MTPADEDIICVAEWVGWRWKNSCTRSVGCWIDPRSVEGELVGFSTRVAVLPHFDSDPSEWAPLLKKLMMEEGMGLWLYAGFYTVRNIGQCGGEIGLIWGQGSTIGEAVFATALTQARKGKP